MLPLWTIASAVPTYLMSPFCLRALRTTSSIVFGVLSSAFGDVLRAAADEDDGLAFISLRIFARSAFSSVVAFESASLCLASRTFR